MAKSRKKAVEAVEAGIETGETRNDENWVFVRGDELGGKAEPLYELAQKVGYRSAIKAAQEIAGVEQNGVMSAEALEAVNAVSDEEFLNRLKNEY